MLKDVIANWSYILISAVAAFILFPFLVHTLGDEQYGVWLLISSITGYFTLLQLGMPLANVRFLSRHLAREEYEQVNTVLRSNLIFYLGIDLVALLVGGLLTIFLDELFEVPPAFIGAGRVALLVATAELALRLLGTLLEGVFHAQQNFVSLNVIRNLGVILRTGATLLLVRFEDGLVWVAGIILAVTALQIVASFLYLRRKYPLIRPGTGSFDRSGFAEVMRFSSMAMLLDVAGRLNFNTDAIVIAAVLTVSSIVPFGIANNILTYLMQFVVGFSAALMPRVTASAARGDHQGVSGQYLLYSRLIAFVSVPTCTALWVYGDDFIALWMGEDYRTSSGQALAVLALGYAFFLVQRGVGFPILMGLAKMRAPSVLMLAGAVVNVGLSVSLAPSMGLQGIAWGTTIPLLLVAASLALYLCRLLELSPWAYFVRAAAAPALSALPFLGCAYYLEEVLPVQGWGSFVAANGVCVLLTWGCVFLLLLTRAERGMMLESLRSRRA